jgi:hypothetical protein
MTDAKMESIVWIFGLVLFGLAALYPQALIRVLGRGRVSSSPGTFMLFRIIAGFCFVGTIYRLSQVIANTLPIARQDGDRVDLSAGGLSKISRLNHESRFENPAGAGKKLLDPHPPNLRSNRLEILKMLWPVVEPVEFYDLVPFVGSVLFIG